MRTGYRTIHKDFQLNGIRYSRKELKEVAYSLVKEGESFERYIGGFLLDWLDSKTVIEVQTSGSTGKPKRIDLQKQHMVNSAAATGAFFGLEPSCSALLCLPANFIAGKMMLVRAMVLGLQLDYIPPSSNPLERLSKRYDFCAMVPFQVGNSVAALSQIKTLIVGGAPMSNALKAEVQEQLQTPAQKTEVFETYGMTETITHIAVKKLNVKPDEVVEQSRSTVGTFEGNGAGCGLNKYFKALPNIKLSKDRRDCLVIDAPKISGSVIITNDVVNLISDTEFEWLGRYDNVINSGGVKLFPEQIEAKLAFLIETRFFVAGLPDEKLGQKLVLFVEGIIDSGLLHKRIKALESLTKFEVPKEIRTISRFHETDNGKIRRAQTIGLIKG